MKHEPGSFPVIRLSRLANRYIEDFKQSAFDVGAATTQADVLAASSRMTLANEALASHIAHLEAFARQHGAAGINATILKRYR